ncbi:MAG: dienelactone hydrolase [Verrucomicrobia bacterium]|nr:dienelactone hydrolase [Verrucomicrobiota bacterium]NDA65771.1 dienelactone hydrolase [Verrucomicrobiota bacterium]NDD37554.1 dienelactone hydrolase [Verrucomicrobiota bacterium]
MRRFTQIFPTILLAAFALCGSDQTRLSAAETPAAQLRSLLVDEGGQPITSAAAWMKRRTALRAEWQAFLGEFSQERVPLKAEVLATETLPDFTRQHVKYQVEDGVFTDAYVLIPKNATDKLPGVVVFHQTVKTQAQQAAGIDASVPELMHGVQLVKRGYVVVCPRCFIFADGAGYADWVKRVQQQHPTWTGMVRMTWDGIRAVDYLESLPLVDRERIGCLGHSLGAKEVLYAAAFDERFKVAVFSEGGIGLTFSNWDAPWYLGSRIKQPGFGHEHHELIALIAPRPFLLLAGNSADSDKSAAFVEAARPVYELLGAKDRVRLLNHRQGHRYPADAQAAAEELLDRHLKP